MNPELLSTTLSLALLAIIAALLLAHLAQLAGQHRLRHAVDALTCAGLVYLFGMSAFGWSAAPRTALCALFALVTLAVVAFGLIKEARGEEAGFPWRLTAIQAAAMAYVFGPFALWKPAVSLLLLFFFALETLRWLSGTEEAVDEAQAKSTRPPLYPPRRVRGVREFALAGTAAVLAYLFAMGTGRAPLTPPTESSEPAAEAVAEPPAEAPTESAGAAQDAAPAAAEASPPAAAPEAAPAPEAPPAAAPAPAVPAYKTVAGDTLKSIATKLYGKPEKWRALAATNPGVKPGAKLKPGLALKLPEPPTR